METLQRLEKTKHDVPEIKRVLSKASSWGDELEELLVTRGAAREAESKSGGLKAAPQRMHPGAPVCKAEREMQVEKQEQLEMRQ